MRITSRILIIIALLLGWGILSHAQEERTEISIDFRVNSTVIDSTYSDNAASIRQMLSFLRGINRDNYVKLIEISLCGAASPEGSDQLNRSLARGRIASLESLIRQEVDYPEGIVVRNDSYIPWEYLKTRVEASDFSWKDEVISILEEQSDLVDYHHPNTHIDSRVIKLKKIEDELFFEPMRNSCVIFVTSRFEPVPETRSLIAASAVQMAGMPALATRPLQSETPDWIRNIHLKTNLLGWSMGATNVGVEYDLAKHLSLALSAYYSGWDYFKPTLKFRTLTVQPELRYYPWLKDRQNEGFFVGIHFGLGYYNYALNNDWRIQDHNGRRPSYGGGLNLGYALQFRKNPRWGMEFAVGAGVYDSLYDMFYNEVNGPYYTTSIRKTWFGLDNAAVSFTYKFDVKQKGGKK